jgi:hypothetical protein
MNNNFLNSIGFKKLLVKLRNILQGKLDKGNYTGTAQNLKEEVDNKLPLTGGNINGELTFIDKIKVVARPDGNSLAFGNKPFNDLVYGEFKGIKLWGNDSNDKVVLAGGGVKNISELVEYLPVHPLNNTKDIQTFLSNGKFFAGESDGTQNMPLNDWMHVFGGRHTNPNNNFSYTFGIPFNNQPHDQFYFTNSINGSPKPWIKFIGFRDVGQGYQEMYNEHGYHLHFPEYKAFRAYQGDIGSGQLKLEVSGDRVYSPKKIESAEGFNFRNRHNDDVLINNCQSLHKDEFFTNRGREFGLQIDSINTFKELPNGIHYVGVPGEGGSLAVFRTGSSANGIHLLAPTYLNHRLRYNWTIDNNRYGSTFKELAYFEDVYRVGGAIQGDWTAHNTHQNNTIFVEASCTVELNQIEHLGSMSFRKVFNGGNINFTCTGKSIIYTGDTTFNGEDGSTAVVSIWNQKCYIDIRNI